MPVERYFIDADLSGKGSITLQESEFHHMAHVVRLRAGEEVELVNGKGQLAKARLEALHKKEAHLSLLEASWEAKPAGALILAQGLPRLNRLDLIVEKGTELGMTELWLFPGERSERKNIAPQQLQRLQAVAIAALKQCGRLWLPSLILQPPLAGWGPLPYSCYYGELCPEAPPLLRLLQEQTEGGSLIVIGPESGLSPAEEAHLRHLHFRGVKLSPNILRTDTAALIAVGLLASQLPKPG